LCIFSRHYSQSLRLNTFRQLYPSLLQGSVAVRARIRKKAVTCMRTSLMLVSMLIITVGPSFAGPHAAGPVNVVQPGAVWLDNRFKEIQAHGGSIIRLRDLYFWFGEDRSPGPFSAKRFVACYSSKDLVHWTFRNRVLALSDREHLGNGWVLERPKVFYNRGTRKFIMYMHIDDSEYRFARVGIAVSDVIDGEYVYVKSFHPLGRESRDIGQFIDDDGSSYLMSESRPTGGFFIAKLSDDYMTVDQAVSFIKEPLEGVSLVRYDGLYYVLGSHISGWEPNSDVYGIARSLSGPWSEITDIAPPDTDTYNSQSTMLLKVTGSRTTSVIYMGDRWEPKALWDSRYVWMPLQIGGRKLILPKPAPWTIDVRSGTTRILK